MLCYAVLYVQEQWKGMLWILGQQSGRKVYVYVCIYIYIYIYVDTYIYIYMYI